MSEGIKSGVNWIRLKETSRISAKVLTISVFARPGTPSKQTVTAGEDCSKQLFNCVGLSHNDLRQL